MFETEVQAGIAILDAKGLDWRRAARSPFLNMAGAGSCILGFTVGDYWKAMDQWGVTQEWMRVHGFVITEETFTELCYRDTYDELAATWRRAAELADA